MYDFYGKTEIFIDLEEGGLYPLKQSQKMGRLLVVATIQSLTSKWIVGSNSVGELLVIHTIQCTTKIHCYCVYLREKNAKFNFFKS
jgi:hypothetical protein